MNSIAISKLGLQKIVAEIEVIRLELEEHDQTNATKEAISCLQTAEDWLTDEMFND
mgnify:CR=1 FL=1